MLDGQILVRPIRAKLSIIIPEGIETSFNEGEVLLGGELVSPGDKITFGKRSRGGSDIDGLKFGLLVEVDGENLYIMPENKVQAVYTS